MPRGYRSALIAAFGWLILAAAPAPNNSAQPQQAQASQRSEQALESIANSQSELAKATDTGEYQRACSEGEDNNRSDLCAQWKAANAATDAARWAFWSMGIGLISIGLLVWTLWETRETSRMELRAYMRPEIGDGVIVVGQPAGFNVQWVNYGKTPAFNCRISSWIAYQPAGWKVADHKDQIVPEDDGSRHIIQPGMPHIIEVRFPQERPFVQAEYLAITNEEAGIFAGTQITYEDCFGRTHKTAQGFEVVGRDCLRLKRSRATPGTAFAD